MTLITAPRTPRTRMPAPDPAQVLPGGTSKCPHEMPATEVLSSSRLVAR